MKIKMFISQDTANYFLANNVKFTGSKTDDNEIILAEITIENGKDLYNIYDAGRCYGRDLPNGF
jgi:hypothetical protein